jgi:hypothetical protein
LGAWLQAQLGDSLLLLHAVVEQAHQQAHPIVIL